MNLYDLIPDGLGSDFFDMVGSVADFMESDRLYRQTYFLHGKTRPFRADGKFSRSEKWLLDKKNNRRKQKRSGK